MRLTPAQMGMSLMIQGSLPMLQYDTRAEAIVRGRQDLVQITGEDFGYDLRAWHDHLVETNAGGYKWSNSFRGNPKAIESILEDEEWKQAVAEAESESLFEKLNVRDARRRAAINQAEAEWAGKDRRCPKCNTEFKSVGDRGQCPSCSYIFYASHPESGKEMWWLKIT